MKPRYAPSPAFCLGVVFSLAGTGAYAANTTTSVIPFAREVAAAGVVYTLPASTVQHSMTVIRGSGQNFFVDVILGAGATWNSSGAPTNSLLTVSEAGAVTYLIGLVGNPAGISTATYLVQVQSGDPTDYALLTFTASGLRVKDGSNTIGAGGIIPITVRTRDSATGIGFDPGADTADFLKGITAITVSSPLETGSAVIDIALNRTKFLNGSTTDSSASLGIDGRYGTPYDRNGLPFILTASDHVDLIVTGDLTGIASIRWGGAAKIIEEEEITASSATLVVPGDTDQLGGGSHGQPRELAVTVLGDAVLSGRTLTLTARLMLKSYPQSSKTLVTASPLTVWTLNGTVLIANWVNGNNATLNSRIYLWNKSNEPGIVKVTVFTLPTTTAGSVVLGVLEWGTLQGRSGANLRLAEDILTPLGIALPYTTNGGNLILEIAVKAPGVMGVSQTFSGGFAFGTYPLARAD